MNDVSAIEDASTVTYEVGELGKEWQFPSDHLPIGLSIGDIHIASWNVLNTLYIHYILSNQQGLKDSMIVTANYPVDFKSPLTYRERVIIEQILEMIDHPVQPRSLIALQEVGSVFFEELKQRLPAHIAAVTPFSDEFINTVVFLYDTRTFDWVSLRSGTFQISPSYQYMTLTLQEKNTGIIFDFVQSHIPATSGISAAARSEFAREVLTYFDENAFTVVMGDMNRSSDFLEKDFQEASLNIGFKEQPLKNLWIPYPTHVDCYKRGSWIDDFFFHNPFPAIPIQVANGYGSFFAEMDRTLKQFLDLRPLPLDVAFEIWCKIQEKGKAVIHGAPASGKTEQMLLALQFKGLESVRFDLRDAFLAEYFKTHQIEDAEEKKQIKKLYSTDDSLQEEEYEWLNAANVEIVEGFLASDAEVVVFDEFDLSHSQDLSPRKVSTLFTIATMAKRLLKSGKKVVLITHDAALSCGYFLEEMEEGLGIGYHDIVKTKYLTDEEVKTLLGLTSLTQAEKEIYMRKTEGIPAAYLELIQALSEGENLNLTFEQLQDAASDRIKKVWDVILRTQPEDVIEMLRLLAYEDSPILYLEPDSLLRTGLVHLENGVLVMPRIVREIVSQ